MEPNDREMYLAMVRASEQAIRALIAAQQTCEAQYISSPNNETGQLSLFRQVIKSHG